MNIEQLKEKTAYDGMPQVWQRGFNVAVREMQKEIEKLKTERAAFIELLQMTVDAGGVLDISERGQIYEAIAKAKGEKA